MLTVAAIWIYVLITTYLVGYGFLSSLVNWQGMKGHNRRNKAVVYEFKFRESYVITGAVLVTVYAQIVSLFTRVGLGANIGLVCICLLAAVYYRRELFSDFLSTARVLGSGSVFAVYLVVFLIMAYGTSHGIMHYDSDLYHAQAIRWIEEYGVVKGLGNLHVRFAYNSAAFPLSAMYSLHFLGGRSYHVMAGFFALLLAWQCIDIKNAARRGHLVISDFARLVAIYYLFTIFDEMVSPASDYFLSTLVFYVIIHLLDMYVRHERSYVPYILLALLGIYAITIKLSAAPMILLAVIPIVKLLRGRTRQKTNAFWISVLLALLITVPFLLRNVLISGWLLYPVTFLDLFGFDWKIPKGVAAFDSLEIRTFGRGYNDVASYGDATFGEWVPHWFSEIGGLNKIMLILAIVSIFVYLLYLAYFLAALSDKKNGRPKESKGNKIFDLSSRRMLDTADFLTIGATLIGCLLFWFMSAPLIRYGVVYVWLTPAVILGRMFIIIQGKLSSEHKSIMLKALAGLFLLWFVYKCANVAIEDAGRFNASYLVMQQDYGQYETQEFKIGDDTYYCPSEGDRIGYYPFPSAPRDMTGQVQLMGKEISGGYMPSPEIGK
jgi:hypothetical protein